MHESRAALPLEGIDWRWVHEARQTCIPCPCSEIESAPHSLPIDSPRVAAIHAAIPAIEPVPSEFGADPRNFRAFRHVLTSSLVAVVFGYIAETMTYEFPVSSSPARHHF